MKEDDDILMDDDGDSSVRFSNLETGEFNQPGIDKAKIQYFGGS